MLTDLDKSLKAYLSVEDIKIIARAFDFAKKAHAGQKRLSGDEFISHPEQVALILAGLKQDKETISAAFLHDVVEDAHIPIEQIQKDFGKDIATLVDGVTKLGSLKFSSKEESQAENVRKMFLAMAKDVRIIFLKLADRLHNMRTLEFLSPEKQIEISQETLDIYAPLAHRLGLGLMKWELEDLAFRYLQPAIYNDLRQKISLKKKEREQYVEEFAKLVRELMKKHGIPGEVSGRSKHFYSIYRKMQSQNLSFEEIYDLWAIRIIVNTEADCYAMLGHIHSLWKPIQGKIKDYIAMPKPNMYQSLHTTVMGPKGRPVEIQIRTAEMHQIAEYGIASHWVYKETDKSKSSKKKLTLKEKTYLDKLSWVRKIAEETKQGKEFIENVKTDLLFGEVYVFTPKGDVFSLPEGATPVDFAYQIHTSVGHRCTGAKVNNKLVPLDTILINGDIVEIITGKEDKPSSNWLEFVKTPRARDKIKAQIFKQRSQEHLVSGKESLFKEFKTFLLDPKEMLKKEFLEPVLQKYSFGTADDLFVAIGKGDVAAKAAARFFSDLYNEKHKKKLPEKNLEELVAEQGLKPKKSSSLGVSVEGGDSIMLRLAHCCYPLPGDPIIGFVTMGYGITVHRTACHNVKNLAERKIAVSWSNNEKHKYQAMVEVLGFDRVGVFKDILNIIADKDTNALEANAHRVGNSEFKARILLEVKDLNHLLTIINTIKSVKDVYDVYRANL